MKTDRTIYYLRKKFIWVYSSKIRKEECKLCEINNKYDSCLPIEIASCEDYHYWKEIHSLEDMIKDMLK
jgi:hypothetical protein